MYLGDAANPNFSDVITSIANAAVDTYGKIQNVQLQNHLLSQGYIPQQIASQYVPASQVGTQTQFSSSGNLLFWAALGIGAIFLLKEL